MTPTSKGESPETKKQMFWESPKVIATLESLLERSCDPSQVEMPADDAPVTEWLKAVFKKMDAIVVIHQELKDLSETVEYSVKKTEEYKEQVGSLTTEVVQLRSKVAHIEGEFQALKKRSSETEESRLKSEISRREHNVIFDGIVDTHREDGRLTYNKVVKVLNHMEVFGGQGNNVPIVKCFRIGQIGKNGHRAVLCQFLRFHDAQLLLNNRKQLPQHVYASHLQPSKEYGEVQSINCLSINL